MIQPPKIIICDSGISTALKNKAQTLDIGQGEIDNNCHGSVLSEVILKYGKNAELTSIKLLDECCESNIEVLYNALDVCSTIEADIICLPLAIDTYSVQAELHDMIKLLADQGKIIISALLTAENTAYQQYILR